MPTLSWKQALLGLLLLEPLAAGLAVPSKPDMMDPEDHLGIKARRNDPSVHVPDASVWVRYRCPDDDDGPGRGECRPQQPTRLHRELIQTFTGGRPPRPPQLRARDCNPPRPPDDGGMLGTQDQPGSFLANDWREGRRPPKPEDGPDGDRGKCTQVPVSLGRSLQ